MIDWCYVRDLFLGWIMELIEDFLDLLPDSPFQHIAIDNSILMQSLNWINYFLPIKGMLAIGTSYLTAIIAWYAYRYVARLVRYIG